MAKPNREYLFVYGTLRRDSNNDMYKLLARHAKFLSDGWFNGKLYNVTYYPCAISTEMPDDKVYGEVYELPHPDFILPILDEYEECGEKFPTPQEYRREKKQIYVTNEGMVDAWVYIYNRDVSHLRRIESGDFYNQS